MAIDDHAEPGACAEISPGHAGVSPALASAPPTGRRAAGVPREGYRPREVSAHAPGQSLRRARSRAIVTSLVLALCLQSHGAELYVAFWNVENLFDTRDDRRTHDDEFTPSGGNNWTEERLNQKFKKLAQVINEMNGGRGPDILGLAEVENRQVLESLVRGHLKRRYAIVHRDSPDERGIDCALLYDPSVLKLEGSRFILVRLAAGDRTRDIVETELRTGGAALHVFVNHWPSRWEGAEKSEPKRCLAAAVLRRRVDELLQASANSDLLVMGDFNDLPSDRSVVEVLKATGERGRLVPGQLLNSTWPVHLDKTIGTMKYRGEWMTFDQIVVSQGLLDRTGFSWAKPEACVFMRDYLLVREGRFRGNPFRTYAGQYYVGGYSDHLPIYCRISCREAAEP